MEKDFDSKPVPKVILWGTTRSCSTAFYRAIGNNKKIKAIFEPFMPNFKDDTLHNGLWNREMLPWENEHIQRIKTECEQAYPGFDAVFIKDVVEHFRGFIQQKYIPNGFTHSFIIRNPQKMALSLYQVLVQFQDISVMRGIDPSFIAFKEQLEMYNFATKELGQDPVIIDADDLVENPEFFMKEYCRRTNLPFSEDILKWDSIETEEIHKHPDIKPWISDAAKSNSFIKEAKNYKYFPENLQDLVDENMPFYKELYSKRLHVVS